MNHFQNHANPAAAAEDRLSVTQLVETYGIELVLRQVASAVWADGFEDIHGVLHRLADSLDGPYDNPLDQVNGYPVLASFSTPAQGANVAGRVVLADRRCDYEHEGFATWWQNAHTGACVTGHYFSDRSEAEKDFLERCAKGY